MTVSRILPLLLFASVAHAEPPWGKVDLQAAPELHQKACAGCHIRMYGGDGSKMWSTRDGRMLSTQPGTAATGGRLQCADECRLVSEEEGTVALRLNQRYYRFEN